MKIDISLLKNKYKIIANNDHSNFNKAWDALEEALRIRGES